MVYPMEAIGMRICGIGMMMSRIISHHFLDFVSVCGIEGAFLLWVSTCPLQMPHGTYS